jgi:hypothetical protein
MGEDLLGPDRELRVRLLLGRPDLRPLVARTLFSAHERMVEVLVEVYPELDTEELVTLVGALIGGLAAATTHAIIAGHPPDRVQATVDRVLDILGRPAETAGPRG